MDPSQRISANDCLKHEYFSQCEILDPESEIEGCPVDFGIGFENICNTKFGLRRKWIYYMCCQIYVWLILWFMLKHYVQICLWFILCMCYLLLDLMYNTLVQYANKCNDDYTKIDKDEKRKTNKPTSEKSST